MYVFAKKIFPDSMLLGERFFAVWINTRLNE